MKRWFIFILILVFPVMIFAATKTHQMMSHKKTIHRVSQTTQIRLLKHKLSSLQSQLDASNQQASSLSIQLQSLQAEKQMWVMIDAKQKEQIQALQQQLVKPPVVQIKGAWFGSEKTAIETRLTNLEAAVFQLPWIKGILIVKDVRFFIALTVLILVLLFIWLLWTFRLRSNVKSLNRSSEKQFSNYKYLAGDDVMASKLDLARSYIDMGDQENARDILLSVLQEGDKKQKTEAKELLKKI